MLKAPSRLLAPILLSFVVVAVLAPAADASSVMSPSGNIRCYLLSGPTELRCLMVSVNGKLWQIKRQGRVRILTGNDDAPPPKAPILRYGHSRRLGPFKCTSRTSGLTCKSTVSGRGVTLSRSRQKRF